MVKGLGGRYTQEQRFWKVFEEYLKVAWIFDPPKQVTNLPDPIYNVFSRYADIFTTI